VERAIIISGFGGQGLLFAGQVLATAAMIEGREVMWIPSYGPEMRGGAAGCTVIVDDEPIGSPVVDVAAVVIALTTPSFEKHGRLLGEGSLLIVDGALVSATPPAGVEIVALPFTQLARAAGDDRLVSVVALGAMLARRPIVSLEALRAGLARVVGAKHPELLAADVAAFESGLREAGGTVPVGGPAAVAVQGPGRTA
jgi:2-oxoglutarate ferredoxin oxidoreductase subunit gamma